MAEELELLKRLYRQSLPETELVDLFYRNRDKYRVLFHLVQQPRFPEKHSLNIIPKLYPMDLIRLIKNKRTNPNIRKRAEMEFVNKYNKFPQGEKLSYMKIAPNSLLTHFVNENDRRLVSAMLHNPNSTEELLLKFVNRKKPRHVFYEVLCETEWFKRPQIALAIANDTEAPIRILVAIIPYLGLRELERIFKDDSTHGSVRQNITAYLQNRQSAQ